MGAVKIGLTGGIAAGKSAVAARLAEHGALIIDSDLLAREAISPGTPGLAAAVERFGQEVVGPGGVLDRSALGRIVFSDPEARQALEAIVHPVVRARAAEILDAAPADAVVVQMIPLLVETGQETSFDLVVVVDAEPGTQVRRLALRNGYSEAEARTRIEAQATREQRLAVADVVIANDSTAAELNAAVDRFWTGWVQPTLRS